MTNPLPRVMAAGLAAFSFLALAACGSREGATTSGGGGSGQGGSSTGAGGAAQTGAGGVGAGGATGAGGGATTTGAGGSATTTTGAGGAGNADAGSGDCTEPPPPSPLMGWAAAGGMMTTGGAGGPTTTVTTLAELMASAGGMAPAIIQVKGTLAAGRITVGSNKTIVGICGAKIQGHLELSGVSNVIIRNVAVVGYNCTDIPTGRPGMTLGCSSGDDAITVVNGAHHIWFDHDDISDGSDGNLDVTNGADFVTISWTKFHYSTQRTDPGGAGGGHRFSNLIGASDQAGASDTGHLNVTFHHVWWADDVYERMPRVRFGQIHLFNNLNTARGDLDCVGLGVGAKVLAENNVFDGATTPFDITSYSDANSALQSTGNVFQGTSGNTAGRGTTAFLPPYSYAIDPADSVEAAVMAGAGPK